MISLQATAHQISTPITCSKKMVGILLETSLSDTQRRYVVNILQNILEIEASTASPTNVVKIHRVTPKPPELA